MKIEISEVVKLETEDKLWEKLCEGCECSAMVDNGIVNGEPIYPSEYECAGELLEYKIGITDDNELYCVGRVECEKGREA